MNRQTLCLRLNIGSYVVRKTVQYALCRVLNKPVNSNQLYKDMLMYSWVFFNVLQNYNDFFHLVRLYYNTIIILHTFHLILY